MRTNLILNTDSYKVSMYKQYPPGTNRVYSYIEARGGPYAHTVFFGLQGWLKQMLLEPITQADIDQAQDILGTHMNEFNRSGWQRILDRHGGYMPVAIQAVPEGTIAPIKHPLLTIENTDDELPWVVTHLETQLLRATWYPTTVATRSWVIKQIILKYLQKNGTPESIDYKLHDFGARAASSSESSAIGGCAHLVNFKGTDTVQALVYARDYYHSQCAGFSIPASEHSTMCAWGQARETQAYRNMLDHWTRPGQQVAVVSDSYDIYHAVETIWGLTLRPQVIDSGAQVIIRPDSGDPVDVNVKLIELLADRFGYTLNRKGYRVVNHVRLIQGDGMTEASITAVLAAFDQRGYSADNIAFGMGGYLLGAPQRDTQQFALKCSAVHIGNQWHDVKKSPLTDPNKQSKAGLVTSYTDGANWLCAHRHPGGNWSCALEPVFSNGALLRDHSLAQIRERVLDQTTIE